MSHMTMMSKTLKIKAYYSIVLYMISILAKSSATDLPFSLPFEPLSC